MVGRDRALQLLYRVLALVPADQAEATLFVQDHALTRFANNSIHQNVARKDARLTVRAVVDGRVGAATTNVLDEEGQRRVAEQAAAIARLQEPAPDFPGLPAGRPPREAATFYEATAGTTARQRAEAVGVVVDAASRLGFQATGAFATEVGELAIANTAGVAVYAPLTLASLRTVVDAGHGQGIGVLTGYADAISRDVGQIDAGAVADRAVAKCALNRDPQLLPPGRYVTVLEEIAVADLLRFLARLGLSAQAVHEGRSFAVGKMGQPVCGGTQHFVDDFPGLARRDVGDRLCCEEEFGLLGVEPFGFVWVASEGDDRCVFGEQLVRLGPDEEVEPVAKDEKGGSCGDGVGADDTSA